MGVEENLVQLTGLECLSSCLVLASLSLSFNASFKCRLLEERDITLYCDLHGHSRKQNVFIYGCENRFDPLKRLRERVFPVMISKNAPSKVQRYMYENVVYFGNSGLNLFIFVHYFVKNH